MKCCVILCIVIIFTGCSQRQESTVTVKELHKLLKPVDSEVYAGFNPKLKAFYIGNRYVQRNLKLDNKNSLFSTTEFIDKKTNTNWISSLSDEFRFRIGKNIFTGLNGELKYKNYQIYSYPDSTKELAVIFEYRNENELVFDSTVHYEVDSSMPVIRKWLEFNNLTDRTLAVEELKIESLKFLPKPLSFYDFQLNKLSTIESSEPLVIAYSSMDNSGLVLSSNIPGALKSYSFSDNKLSLGFPSDKSSWKTEIKVPARERKSSPIAFIMPFNRLDNKWHSMWLKFIRRYFVISSLFREPVSTVVFSQIDEEIAFESDAKLICVDWNLGDMNLDRLVEISQRVHENQQKFGIRLKLTVVSQDAEITEDWHFRKHNGKSWISLSEEQKEKVHLCLASNYAVYVTNYLIYLADKVNLDYIVFDGSVFGPDENNIGCASYKHWHSGPADSVISIYQSLFNIANSLHRNHQELVIAISSDTYASELPDYGLISYIDQFVFDLEKSDFNTVFPKECIVVENKVGLH